MRRRRSSPHWSARSSRAGAARGSSPGASRSRASAGRRSPTRPTGAARSPASATPARGCSSSGWRPPRTGPTARGASSPATGRATSCSRRCTARASRRSRRAGTRGDGLRLTGAWIAAAVRCAPPANRPTPQERDTCLPWTARELDLLPGVARRAVPRRVRVGRGAAPARGVRAAASRDRGRGSATAPHGIPASSAGRRSLGCFHPSQQNTFTGRLTPAMLDEALRPGARAQRGPAAYNRLSGPGSTLRTAMNPRSWGFSALRLSNPRTSCGSTVIRVVPVSAYSSAVSVS